MLKVVIIGWYGTETIGDRAILSGIISVLKDLSQSLDIRLGSLYPFFSERVLIEDEAFHKSAAYPTDIKFSLFDSTCEKELSENIKGADTLIMGGGPLMDIPEMYMVKRAFLLAKKHSIKSVVMGCGWGPLISFEYINIACDIINLSDLTIFRDKKSYELYTSHIQSKCISNQNVHCLIDPAFFSAINYRKTLSRERQNEAIAFNVRNISTDTFDTNHINDKYMDVFVRTANSLIEKFNCPINLIPMHTFHIGGDDRVIMDKMAKQISNSNVNVIHDPLSLKDVMDYYYDAKICVGVRFHSIVLQTVLNGKNYIIDYTDPKRGKTIGMLNDIGFLADYKNRYSSLFNYSELDYDLNCERFQLDLVSQEDYFNQYIHLLNQVLL